MERSRIGFVTGMLSEARLLRGTGFPAAAGGGTPEGALAAAEQLAAQGAEALVSFGLAGGLAPALKPGDVLVPSAVIDGQNTYPCNLMLMEFLGGGTGGPILASRQIAATAREKTQLHRSFRADAVDMESGMVARVASTRGLAFAVLRAVADPAGRDLPPAALHALNAQGGVEVWAVLRSLLARPGQLPALLALAREAGQARAALALRLRDLV